MNLTEPQAGSDLNAVTTRAEKQKPMAPTSITGTKIFITYGDHEMTENIIHLVLARLPDAPPGTRGISLFLVPKRLVNSRMARIGARNDVVTCASLEHKLGIHASPTASAQIRRRRRGRRSAISSVRKTVASTPCFIMMNAARLAVGVQGVAIAERATQRAHEYANERKQGPCSRHRPRAS